MSRKNSNTSNYDDSIPSSNYRDMADLAEQMNEKIPGVDDNFGEQNSEKPSKISKDAIEYFKEPTIILCIFFILSLPSTQTFIASYVPQIGEVNFDVTYTSILINGIILVSLIFVVRKVLSVK